MQEKCQAVKGRRPKKKKRIKSLAFFFVKIRFVPVYGTWRITRSVSNDTHDLRYYEVRWLNIQFQAWFNVK